MSWTTVHGSRLEFPHAIFAKLLRASRPSHDDIYEALDRTRRIQRAAVELSVQVSMLQEEVRRLRHENEFMLRLINDRDP